MDPQLADKEVLFEQAAEPHEDYPEMFYTTLKKGDETHFKKPKRC